MAFLRHTMKTSLVLKVKLNLVKEIAFQKVQENLNILTTYPMTRSLKSVLPSKAVVEALTRRWSKTLTNMIAMGIILNRLI